MIYIFAASILFGLVHPGSKLIMSQGVDPLSFSILYVLIRLIMQSPVVIKSASYRVSRRESWICLFMIGIIGAGLQFCEFKGIASGLSVPLVTFLVYSHPIWSLIFSRVINSEPLNFESFLKLFSGLLGILFIVGSNLRLSSVESDKLMLPLIAGMLIALWVSLSNKAKKFGSSSWTISFYYDLFALLALISMRLTHATSAMSFFELWGWVSVPSNLLAMVIYSLAVGLLPNILFYHGNALTTARAVGLILLVEPMMATMVSHWIWLDQLSPSFFLGAAFILFTGVPMKCLKFREAFRFLSQRLKPISFLILTLLLSSMTPNFAKAGDPPATHGMLVFGDGSIYFSHLPMFHSPHDYQTIFQANMGTSANEIFLKDQQSHPGAIYTFVPKAMVLPDVIVGKRNFSGDLYRGHFERGGIVLKKSILVEISSVVYFHKFSPADTPIPQLTYLLFGDGPRFWLAHLISQKPDFDHIVAVDSASSTWDHGHVQKIIFQNLPNQSPVNDDQNYIGYIGNQKVNISHTKTKYLEFEDLSM